MTENFDRLFCVPKGSKLHGCRPPNGRQIWYVNADGMRHGPAIRWHADGAVKYSATMYLNGQREGPFRQWHENGQVEIKGGFVDDLPEGQWNRYEETGALVWESTCRQGQLLGEARSFYENGQCSRYWENYQGKVHGTSIVFDMSGDKLVEEQYVAGLREGTLKRWQMGVLVEKSHWLKGKRHGEYAVFWWDGSPLETGTFASGIRVGAWKRYWYGGELEWSGDYVDGKRNGLWVFSDAYGAVTAEVEYCHDQVSELLTGALPAEAPAVIVEPPAFDTAFTVSSFVRGAIIPATIVSGFLGAGKTTAIQSFLRHRPKGESWVIYVNEYGEVGIDGAAFPSANGLFIEELAGGCACCVSNLPFMEGLQRLLTRMRPDHLIIEPSGLADPWAIEKGIQERLLDEIDIRARICLVDPRKLDAPTYRDNPIFERQLEYCDLLVANRCDLASEGQLKQFRELALAIEASAVLETTHGRIEPEWLARISRKVDLPSRLLRPPRVAAKGWLFGQGQRFSRVQIEKQLCQVMLDRKLFPSGWLRAKGIFHCDVGFFVLNVDVVSGEVVCSWQSTSIQEESRFECVAPAGVYEWSLLEQALLRASMKQ